ncbi:Fe2OG dioxygenase domain-containing protein [Psidium guajava]|nr:Fe2OG dioxygenase domain-containing protein [Psidium guajava]
MEGRPSDVTITSASSRSTTFPPATKDRFCIFLRLQRACAESDSHVSTANPIPTDGNRHHVNDNFSEAGFQEANVQISPGARLKIGVFLAHGHLWSVGPMRDEVAKCDSEFENGVCPTLWLIPDSQSNENRG